jgi:hypothetical protein
MNLENVFVIDAEFDGFLDKLTKMHVMSVGYFTPNGWKIKSTPNKSDVKKVFENPNNTVVGHNFISFDLPALKKVYPDIDFKALIVDTLPLSQYLHPNRIKHSLESWANEINGVNKVEMTDWENLTYEEYRERCHADVEINIHIWLDFYQNLKELYLENVSGLMGAVKLGNFIREVLRIQEENPIKVDVKKCKDNLNFLEGIINEKVGQLASIMPRVPKIAIKKKPSILFKKDGSMSLAHIKWLQFLQGCDLPEDTEGPVEYISSYEDPNPQSTSQMKAYLFTKKWIPKLFKDGANGKVPQLRDDDKNLCTSIIKLIDKVPELESLSGLSVAQHRAGYLKAFLDTMDENGFVRAKFSSIAKTWRVKHIKPIVNLPSNDSEYGDLVRSCLVAPKDKYFVNYDLDSLEDRTKRACIIHIDPDYVKEMSDPDYDPHLAIGVQAGLLSQDESDFFKWFKSDKKKGECPEIFRVYSEEGMYEQFKRLSKVRSASKTTNYACVPVDNTEVLTKGGWKSYGNLSLDDEVLSYNQDKNLSEFSNIDKIYYYQDANVVLMGNSRWEVESTENHRWLVDRNTGRGRTKRIVREYKTTKEIKTNSNIIISKGYEGGDWDITVDESSLLSWILSDGYFKWSKDNKKTSSSNGSKRGAVCSISQSKKKYYLEIKTLLDRLDVKYIEYTNNSDVDVFQIESDWFRSFIDKLGIEREDKHNVNWTSHILKMSKECLLSFFESFIKADGYLKGTNKNITITQNEGGILDAIELCGNLLGYKSSRSLKHNSEKCYEIYFNPNGQVTAQKFKKRFSRVVDVFCLSTKNSNFIIRQNNRIMLTGNCTYNAGVKKIAETADITLKLAQQLHSAYWEKNASVKVFTESLTVKRVRGLDWIYSPYTNMWLYLSSDHIKFSALNQNFGSKIHFMLLYFLVEKGYKPIMNIHDEGSMYIGRTDFDKNKFDKDLKDAMGEVNKAFDFGVEFGSSAEYADSYGDVH